MTIDICRTKRATGESQFTPICSADQYRQLWQPAISQLNLPMLDCLPALEVTSDFREQFLAELERLETWALRQEEDAHVRTMLESIELILSTVESTDLSECDISFG